MRTVQDGYSSFTIDGVVWHQDREGYRWKHGTRKGDKVIKLGASDTNHPEEPHYGYVGNTINPNTGGYDGF